MANRVLRALQFETQEQRQIVLMLCTGFFMGVFIATYQVTADSLFLNRLGDQLDKAFLIAGLLGILTTALFSTAQNWVKYTTLAVGSVVLIFSFTLAAYWLIHYGGPTYQDNYIFALYCMTGPITAVLLLSFWGIFGRLSRLLHCTAATHRLRPSRRCSSTDFSRRSDSASAPLTSSRG
jgi:hypothetical protein